jgi:hypothetical protein
MQPSMLHCYSWIHLDSSLADTSFRASDQKTLVSRSRNDSTVFAECIVYRFFGVRAIARIAHRAFHDAVPAFTYERIECTSLTGLGAQNKASIARLHINTQFHPVPIPIGGCRSPLAFRLARLCGRCLIQHADYKVDPFRLKMP